MGNILKFLCCGGKADEGAALATRPRPDFDPNAELGDEKTSILKLPAAGSFKIVVSEDANRQRYAGQPPSYDLSATALLFLLLGRALDVDMEFFFMSRSNTESHQLTNAERKKAEALDMLWYTQNWSEAKALVETNTILQNMGLVEWINANSPAEEEIQRTGPGAEGGWMASQRTGGYRQPQAGAQAVNSQGATTTETAKERFTRLLNHVRDLKVPLWQGFDQRDITLARLQKEHKSAVQKSKKQPKSLNNVRFTFEREIGRYRRLMAGNEAVPTTVLLLTGSPLQPTEADNIIKFQENNSIKKDRGGNADGVRGQGSQFCIQTMAWTEHMDEEGKDCLRRIDDAFKGDDDINDLTEVNDTLLLRKGPAAKLLLKVLNSHNKAVDSMQLKKQEDMYGRTELVRPNEHLTMPTFKEVAKILGQDDDDSDEGEEDGMVQERVQGAALVVDGGVFGNDSKATV
ncbi:hypothetical protein B0H63DRAFT_522534 [Podospora didyma]|uniref:Uncharacterized protein n=1 Tax=Podospora didyma TaxID=330526 RepID=A0AAE0TZE7_9PEZI|nr:hypothetical protein B0H63DRAFT_522534 [Podospora didyma]